MSGKNIIKAVVSVSVGMLCCYVTNVMAAKDIAGIADTITSGYESISKLMVGTSYLAGIGMTIAAIFKFKQHKDNPQQVPMGTPIAFLLVGIALIFLPSIIAPAGSSIFGEGAIEGGFTGGGLKGAISGS